MEQNRPTFSVIVPTYGRHRQLSSCLQALAQLDYPREFFEVIIVDDGSEIPAESILNSFRDEIDIQFLRQDHAGPATARNRGAQHAKKEFLAFTDDDCAPASDWLSKLAYRFEELPNHGIGGRILNSLTENLYSAAGQLLTDYLYAYYHDSNGKARFFASNNLAFPVERFREIGGFDKTFPLAAGEDREFCDRWLRKGYGLIYGPEVVVYHSHDLTLRTFLRQHFNYGRGAFFFHQLRPEKIKVESFSFYIKMLHYPFRQSCRHKSILSALLALSQVANTSGYFWEKRSGKKAWMRGIRK